MTVNVWKMPSRDLYALSHLAAGSNRARRGSVMNAGLRSIFFPGCFSETRGGAGWTAGEDGVGTTSRQREVCRGLSESVEREEELTDKDTPNILHFQDTNTHPC